MELRVTDLAVARAGVPVLEGVSFRLLPGRALVLRGPNGIGKTTLLRTLAGLQPALSGRGGAGGGGVAYAAPARGGGGGGGGGVARWLVRGRPIWVMDEPTISLDAASVALFGAVVGRHLAQGGAALIATHIDLGIAAEVLDLAPFKARAPGLGGRIGAFDEAFG